MYLKKSKHKILRCYKNYGIGRRGWHAVKLYVFKCIHGKWTILTASEETLTATCTVLFFFVEKFCLAWFTHNMWRRVTAHTPTVLNAGMQNKIAGIEKADGRSEINLCQMICKAFILFL